MTIDEISFIDKWKNKIISLGGNEKDLKEIIKKSSSPFTRDHLYTWLDCFKNVNNQVVIINYLGKYLEEEVNLEKKLFPEKYKLDEIPNKLQMAIKLYEYNISNNFEGNFPFDRLCVIYKKYKRKDDIIRVLEKAIYVFENIVTKSRGDRLPKLDEFREKLKSILKDYV